MFEIPITVAQAAAELPDPTPGQILGGLSLMGAMSGSLLMMAIWIARLKSGGEVMPFAARKPLCVPWPLTGFGLFLATMMAISVVFGSTIDPELLGKKEDATEVAETVAETETTAEVGNEETSDPQVAETAEGDVSVDQNANEDNADEDAAAAPNLSPVEMKQKLMVLMMSNILSSVIMFAVFGLTIWIFQQSRSRQMMTIHDVGYTSSVPMASASVAQVERFPDLDAAPAYAPTYSATTHAAIPDATNPFAAPADARMISRNDLQENAEVQSPLPLEKWSFPRELWFAFETFLVAYLPTTLIRVLFVSNSPDTQSHPFLEMLENGVDSEIMILIFLMAVVVAPVVEELMFRVAIFGGMYQRHSFMLGMVISSVLFGLAHGYPDCFALLPLAVAIAFTYSRRRSYRTAVLIHFLFNGFNMMLAGVTML